MAEPGLQVLVEVALRQAWRERAGVEASVEEHCAALAEAVMPLLDVAPRVSIERELGKPTRCMVWQGSELVFSGVSHDAMVAVVVNQLADARWRERAERAESGLRRVEEVLTALDEMASDDGLPVMLTTSTIRDAMYGRGGIWGEDLERWKPTSYADSVEAAIHMALVRFARAVEKAEQDVADVYRETRRLVRGLAIGAINAVEWIDWLEAEGGSVD